jgi:hypothetical protein
VRECQRPAGRRMERRGGRHLPRRCLPNVGRASPPWPRSPRSAPVNARLGALPAPVLPFPAAPDLVTHSCTKRWIASQGRSAGHERRSANALN